MIIFNGQNIDTGGLVTLVQCTSRLINLGYKVTVY